MVAGHARPEAQRHFTDDEIQSLVQGLLSDESDPETGILKRIGDRAVPFLVAALDDPKLHVVHRSARGMKPGHFLATSPIERVVDVLWDHRPADAVPALTRLILHEDSNIRSEAV
jgi:hypothetical protein